MSAFNRIDDYVPQIHPITGMDMKQVNGGIRETPRRPGRPKGSKNKPKPMVKYNPEEPIQQKRTQLADLVEQLRELNKECAEVRGKLLNDTNNKSYLGKLGAISRTRNQLQKMAVLLREEIVNLGTLGMNGVHHLANGASKKVTPPPADEVVSTGESAGIDPYPLSTIDSLMSAWQLKVQAVLASLQQASLGTDEFNHGVTELTVWREAASSLKVEKLKYV